MTTSYVYLQEQVIRMLHSLVRNGKGDVAKKFLDQSRRMIEFGKLDVSTMRDISATYPNFFQVPDLTQERNSPEIQEFDWLSEEIPKIIIEQLDDSEENLIVNNILGTPLYKKDDFGYDSYVKNYGSGHNRLRVTGRLCQPRALRIGDILATGETVVREPREGGNGAVLVCLGNICDASNGDWLDLPARIPIALYDPEIAPPEILNLR